MTPRSAAAVDAARELWVRTVGETSVPEEVAAAADQMCNQLRVVLGRWIGAEGYRSVLSRALQLARAEHRSLDGLSCLGEEGPAIAAAVYAHGPRDVAAGFVALVTVLCDLLGRIIGEEMAVRLVGQTDTTSPRGVASTEIDGDDDG